MKGKRGGNHRREGRIATYASCGRIVRVGWSGNKGRGILPEVALIVCPACGFRHFVHLFWRQLAPLDEGREVELTLPDAALRSTSKPPPAPDADYPELAEAGSL